MARSAVLGFYCICIKKKGNRLRYGQSFYDFNTGVMSFLSPHQVFAYEEDICQEPEDISLVFHPDFLGGFPLAASIKYHRFFSYAVNEALHLSTDEEEIIHAILRSIEKEYHANIDQFSQPIIIAQIELLLQYCDRFYNRQFITRKITNEGILIKLDRLLDEYLSGDRIIKMGLPTVQYLASTLSISVDYLTDLLRRLTGQTTQQVIHQKIMEKGKTLLSTTNRSVKEIAYDLGFEYPQSFNKLFKSKTNMSPLAYRSSFN